MKRFSLIVPVLLAASLTTISLATAQPMPPPADRGAWGPGVDGGGSHGGHDRGPGMHGLHGVDLTEAQQDKLFAIMHAAAPAQRQHEKAIRQAHEALRAAADGQFDEAKAAAAAQALGREVAAEALERARIDAQLQAMLTPEQREKSRREHPHHP